MQNAEAAGEPQHASVVAGQLPFIVPSVTKLRDAGVRFRRKEFRTRESYSVLKVTFSSEGVLEIPFLFLHGDSNCEFRNFVAFEQSYRDLPKDEHVFTGYCLLMASLMDTEGDVEVLEEHGVISNFMGNTADVVKMFHKICKGVTIDHMNNCYRRVLEDMARYCASDHHRWPAKLVHDFFLMSISMVAAVVLLVYAYYYPQL